MIAATHNFDIPNFIISIATLICLTVIGVVLVVMMRRQRGDVKAGRRHAQAQTAFSAQLEQEERKTRHAIKNLAGALQNLVTYVEAAPKLDFKRAIAGLDEPPDFVAPEDLIDGLVGASELGGEPA